MVFRIPGKEVSKSYPTSVAKAGLERVSVFKVGAAAIALASGGCKTWREHGRPWQS